jgi:hypothetical protein
MATSPRYYLLAGDGTIHRLARSTFYDLILEKAARRAIPRAERSTRPARHDSRSTRRQATRLGRQCDVQLHDLRGDGFFDSGEWDQASDFTIQTWELPTVDSPLCARLRGGFVEGKDGRSPLPTHALTHKTKTPPFGGE